VRLCEAAQPISGSQGPAPLTGFTTDRSFFSTVAAACDALSTPSRCNQASNTRCVEHTRTDPLRSTNVWFYLWQIPISKVLGRVRPGLRFSPVKLQPSSIQRLYRESTERKACTNCGQTKDLTGADFEAPRGVLSVSRGCSTPGPGENGRTGPRPGKRSRPVQLKGRRRGAGAMKGADKTWQLFEYHAIRPAGEQCLTQRNQLNGFAASLRSMNRIPAGITARGFA